MLLENNFCQTTLLDFPIHELRQLVSSSQWAHSGREALILALRRSNRLDLEDYLERYPDVAGMGMEPLRHYVMYGADEGRIMSKKLEPASVDIVMPVYNGMEYLGPCLESIEKCAGSIPYKIYIIDDKSQEATANFIRNLPRVYKNINVFVNEKNLGYTKTINRGLKLGTAPFALLLNHDTIVTKGWLESLIRCMQSDPHIGVAGLLSNAAGYQSVPRIRDEDGQFAVNELPLTANEMSSIVKKLSFRSYPRLPVINGFCFMIRRQVLRNIGYFDEVNYPICYGEEDEFCYRATLAGYELAVADDGYVRHLKSKTYGNARRLKLSAMGIAAFERLYSREIRLEIAHSAENNTKMAEIRTKINECLRQLNVRGS